MTVSSFILITALGFLAVHLTSIILALWHMRGRATGTIVPLTDRITLLRPVAGLDPFDAETLASSFTQDWPDYEVIFCAPSEDDSAVPLVRQLIAAHPHVKARLLTGQKRITGNPKLDNLWKGWEASDAPWVCMSDSNVILPPDYLRMLAGRWQADTGLVTSPACGLRPEGMAGRIEAAFLNSNQGRLQLCAGTLGWGYAQGKTLFWNRALLEAWGGLLPLGRWLAEDVASTKLVRAAGKKVRLAPRLYPQPIGRKGFRQVWDRQLRWSRVRRDGFIHTFPSEILNGSFLPLVLMLSGLALSGLSFGWLLLYLTLWFGGEWILCKVARWPASPADVVAMILRDMMMPVIFVTTFASRQISWRGTAMRAPDTHDDPVPAPDTHDVPVPAPDARL